MPGASVPSVIPNGAKWSEESHFGFLGQDRRPERRAFAMPRNASKPKMKLKTHRGARKRFKVTATGKILRGHTAKRHFTGLKASGRMRKLKKLTTVSPQDVASIKQMLPYG
jgi:large subunit ribosomal protein L35